MIKNKLMVILSFIIVFNILNVSLNAQISDNKYQFPEKEWNVGIAYFGEFVLRPGFTLSADYPVRSWNKIMDKKKGKKYRSIALHLGGRYWNYYQPKSHNGNALDLEFIVRKTRAFDYKDRIGVLDFGLSAGLGWNKLHGSVYQTTNDGFEKGNRRQSFFSYGFFMSFGRNIMNDRNIPLHWYIKPKLIVETPYAPYRQLHPSIELGVNFPLSYFIKTKK